MAGVGLIRADESSSPGRPAGPRGLTNQEIAAALHVRETTVKTYVAHLVARVQLRDRVQAVIHAYETGIVRPASS